MAFQAGTAFVPVMPSLRGFHQQIVGAARSAGRDAAKIFSDAFGDGAEQGGRSVASRMQGAFGGLNGAMSGIGLAGGAALTAALVKGVNADAARAKLGAQLGLTAKDSARLGKAAGQLYSKGYGESLDEVHDALGAVVTSIDGMRTANDKAVKDMTAKALSLSEVFGLEVARTVQVVGQLVRTGLVKDANQGMDLLTASLQKVPVAVREDLLDALDEYGPFMEQIGIKGQRAFEVLVSAAGKGAFGLDKTGDAFKELTLKVASTDKAVGEAFASIGLTQAEMQTAFAKGGEQGARAFQRIVNGLLGVKDPAKRAETAIALFGTPIEDLNTKDIPSFLRGLAKTGNALGNTSGAADRLGKTMHSGPAAEFEQFKRSAEQNITNTVINDVIPRLEQLGKVGKSLGIGGSELTQAAFALTGLAVAYKVAGAAAVVATTQVRGFSIASTFAAGAGAASQFVAGMRNVSLAYAANATAATTLGAALRSQIMLWRQQAAAAGVSTARIIANAAAQKVAAVATRAWAIAQGIFNAVMSANPIALVVIAIGALVAAAVLAYNRVGWFRTMVNAAWAGIRTAIATAWAFIQPIFRQIASVLVTVVGTALRWYWAYVKFVFTTVWTIIQTTWNFIRPIFMAIVGFIRGVLGVAWIVLRNVVKGVWIAIQIYIKVAWTLIKGYFNLIKWYITNVVAPAFRWLYNNVVKPIWNAIKAAISLAWTIIKGIWNAIKAYIQNVLAPVFRWIYNNIIKPIWTGIKNHISGVWRNGIKPAFDALKSGVGTVKSAFQTAVDGIKRIWDRLKDIAKVPVNFVIGLYNDGIVALVNKIAGVAGINTRLDKIPKFATGGVLPGYSPGRDSLLAAVSPGESIFRPEFTRAVGSSWVTAANAVARRSGVEGVRRWMTGPNAMGGEGLAFARGGIVPGGFAGHFALGGIIDGFVKGVKDFTIGNIGKAAKGLLDKVLGGNVPGSGIMRNVVAAIPAFIKDKILGWIKGKIESGVGGAGVQRALAFARSQNGKPYVWGGVGPGGYDCSGFMSALTNVIKGKRPYSRLFTTHSFGADSGPGGFVRGLRSGFTVGVTDAGVGHMAGTLGGVNVESSGSRGVSLGPSARGTSNGMFTRRYGLRFANGGTVPLNTGVYDRGGLLMPGWTLAYNGTGQPEPILSFARGGLVPSKSPFGYLAPAKQSYSRLVPATGQFGGGSSARAKAGSGLLAGFGAAIWRDASKIGSWFSKLIDQIKKNFSGATEKRMLTWATGIQKALSAAHTKAAGIASTIAQALEYATTVTASAKDYASLSGLANRATPENVAKGLEARASSLTSFAGMITQLRQRGLARGLLEQIIGMGAGEGGVLAKTLLTGTGGAFSRLNAAQLAIDKAATGLGRSAADALYDSGKGASRGFLTGLYAAQAELHKLMDSLGRRLADGVRKSFGIKPAAPAKGGKPRLTPARGVLKYDSGGLLHQGLQMTYHGTRRPDRVLTDGQWSAIYAAAKGGDGGGTTYNLYPRTLDMTVRDLDLLQRKQDARARVGRPR